MIDTLKGLYAVVQDRKDNPQEGSYTCYLFEKGLDKILNALNSNGSMKISRRQDTIVISAR